MKTINKFRGDFAFLSNFYPCRVEYERQAFGSAEAAFQAAKCRNPRDRIPFQGYSPSQAKIAGRRAKLRSDWEQVKSDAMYDILKSKFSADPVLAHKLLETDGFALVEGNQWHDNFWGDCSCPKCKSNSGQNMLGKLLMQIRSELMIAERKAAAGPFYYEGRWYQNTGLFCRRCHRPVYKSDNSKYSYQCFYCDEDLFPFEAESAAGKHWKEK